MQIQNLAPSTKIYSGDAKCPRTVVVQVLNPNANSGVNKAFVHNDKNILDNATVFQSSTGNSYELTDGVDVVDPFGDTVRLIIPACTSDIYIRGLTNNGVNPGSASIIIGVFVC